MVIVERMTLAVACALALAGQASAQTVGIRAGVSGEPDQFFFGGHVESRPIARRLTFRPNLEIGVGDHVTLVAANVELAYVVPLNDRSWDLYVGGGPAVNFYSARGHGRGRDDDGDVGGGFNVLIGAEHNQGLFGELKVGAIDSPDVKLTIGYTWR